MKSIGSEPVETLGLGEERENYQTIRERKDHQESEGYGI